MKFVKSEKKPDSKKWYIVLAFATFFIIIFIQKCINTTQFIHICIYLQFVYIYMFIINFPNSFYFFFNPFIFHSLLVSPTSFLLKKTWQTTWKQLIKQSNNWDCNLFTCFTQKDIKKIWICTKHKYHQHFKKFQKTFLEGIKAYLNIIAQNSLQRQFFAYFLILVRRKNPCIANKFTSNSTKRFFLIAGANQEILIYDQHEILKPKIQIAQFSILNNSIINQI